MGFGPQLVDIDADGDADLISGDWSGRIILFRRSRGGSFLPGEPIKDGDGKPLKVDYGVYSFAHDWDADGDYDLLAGTVDTSGKGNVYLLTNEGTPEAYKFGNPTRVLASGEEIVTPGGDAAPIAADWDGDDKPDLIIGCGDGSVIWYRNIGSRHSPKFSIRETLVPEPEKDAQRGVQAKVCVTDWNEDGEMDLLIGDCGKQFDKILSDEEQRWRDDARQRQKEVLSTWAQTFRQYRDLLRQGSSKDSDDDKTHEANVTRIREQLAHLKNLRNRYYEEEQALEPGKQYHGRLWVYFGQAKSMRQVAD